MGSTRALFRFDEAKADQRSADALGRVSDLVISPNILDSQAVARRVLGWGQWNHGFNVEDVGKGLKSMWGGVSFSQTAGAPLYKQQGPRAGKSSVAGGGIPNLGPPFYTSAPTPFQAGAAEDFAFLGVLGSRLPTQPNNTGIAFFQSTPFGAPFIACRYVFDSSVVGFGGYFDFLINDSVTTIQAFVAADITKGPFAYGGVIDRSTNKARVAYSRLDGGGALAAAEISTAGFGAMNHAGAAYIMIDANAQPSNVSHFLICQGTAAAKGVSANLPTVVQRYADAVMTTPSIVDAATGRGRSFVALSRNAVEGADSSIDTTAATRDATVQALVKWDLADQSGASLWTLAKTVTGAADAWDGGASTVETFAVDGYVEHTAAQTSLDYMLGLSDVDSNVNFNSIVFAMFVRSNGTLEVYETGVVKGNFGAYVSGDVLRIERSGGVVTYKKNGAVLYTSLLLNLNPLRVDLSVFAAGVIVRDVFLVAAGVRSSVTWQNVARCTIEQREFGTLYARGKGDSAAEYIAAGIEVRAANGALNVGELRWLWQTSGGALKRQSGGYFQAPSDGSSILLTATRRWASPTSVILRHYLGGTLLSEVESTDGDIGGSTSGTTTIGGRRRGGYPRTAEAMKAACANLGAWISGYALDETVGSLQPMFGAVPGAMPVAFGAPLYGFPGIRAWLESSDLAVSQTDNAAALWSGGNNLNLTNGIDVAIAWSGYFDAAPGALRSVANKWDGGLSKGWYLLCDPAQGFRFGTGGVGGGYVGAFIKGPHVGVGFVDRGAGLLVTIVREIGTGRVLKTTSVIPDVDEAHATQFQLGSGVGLGGCPLRLSSLWFAHGAGACASFAANAEVIVGGLASAVGDYYGDFFDGTIDELRVCDYEMSREEIEATWKRLSKYQPDGYRRMNDLMQPGLPISDDPSSRVQSDIRTMGTALGYGDAQIENVRENMMPDRAYGRVLERWEDITQRIAKPSDSVDKRRARVTGHIGKRDGVSPPGVANATAEVLATTPANIPIIAFSNTIRDPFIAVEGERWLSGLGPTPIGLGTTTVAGTRVTKNAGVNGAWDAGCSASTRIIGDGRIDTYQQAPNANEQRIIGFTDLAAPTHSFDIKWALYFGRTGSNSVDVYELGNPMAATTFVLDDLFTVRRRGDTIEYMKNETVFYTSLVKSTAALALDIALLNTTPSYLPDIRMMKDAASEVEIIFDSRVNVGITYELICPYGARVLKTGGVFAFDAGCSSNETIDGDGYVEIFVNNITTTKYFGLTDANEAFSLDPSTLDYSIRYDVADYTPTENGVAPAGTVTGLVVGDVLRIERIGSVIVYKRNGSIYYTSTVQTVAPLRVVACLATSGCSLDGLRIYNAGVRTAITWQNATGVAASGDVLRMNAPGLNVQWDPSNANGMRCVMPVEAPRPQSTFYNQLHAFCALDLVTANTQIESGIVLWNPEFSPQCMCFFGVRYNAGTVQVGYEYFRTGDGFGFDQAWTVLATTSQTKHWLRVRPRDGAFGGGSQDHPYQLSWSTTGNQEANFSHSTVIQYRRYVGWWGLYTRSINGTSPVFDIRFSEVAFRNGLGSRPFYWYALRDPALPGVPDVQGARPIATQLAQAFTVGHVCSRKSFLLDDPLCTCDGGPMGGL